MFAFRKPSITRRSAIAVAAAAMVGLSTFGGGFSASAQQVSRATQELTRRVLNDPSITLDTNCTKYLPNEIGADVLCLYRQNQILEAQGRKLDAENRALDKAIQTTNHSTKTNQAAAKCIDAVTSEINDAKKKLGPLSPQLKNQFRARIEACDRVS